MLDARARERRELLRDMSAAWIACNTLLQQLGGIGHKSIFGSAERRRARLERLAGYVEALR